MRWYRARPFMCIHNFVNHYKYIVFSRLRIERMLRLSDHRAFEYRTNRRVSGIGRYRASDYRSFFMKIIDEMLQNKVSLQAKESPGLRMNYDLRDSASDGSQRMLNAIEPGSPLPHPSAPEILRNGGLFKG